SPRRGEDQVWRQTYPTRKVGLYQLPIPNYQLPGQVLGSWKLGVGRYSVTGFPSGVSISTGPAFNFRSSGSIFARSPTATTTIRLAPRYFLAAASAWSAVTAFT